MSPQCHALRTTVFVDENCWFSCSGKLCHYGLQGSLLDNQDLLESLNQAKAQAATINASLQESRNVQVSPLCPLQTVCVSSRLALC